MPQLNFRKGGVIVFKKTLILSLLFFIIVSVNNFITVYALGLEGANFSTISSRRSGNQIIVKGYFYNPSNRKVRVNYIEFSGNGVYKKRFNLNFIMQPHSNYSTPRTFSILVYGKGNIRFSATTNSTSL